MTPGKNPSRWMSPGTSATATTNSWQSWPTPAVSPDSPAVSCSPIQTAACGWSKAMLRGAPSTRLRRQTPSHCGWSRSRAKARGATCSPAQRAGRQTRHRSPCPPDSGWSGSSSCRAMNSGRGSCSRPTPRDASSPVIRATKGSCGSPRRRSTAPARRSSKRSPCRSRAPRGFSGHSTRSTSCATAAPAADCIASPMRMPTTRSTRSKNSVTFRAAVSTAPTTSCCLPMGSGCSSSAATTRRRRSR